MSRMKKFRALLLALLLPVAVGNVIASPSQGGHGVHWAYDGNEGPKNWGKLSPDYQTCSTGKAQSPIDIADGKAAILPGIGVEYPQTGLRIVNNGHTIQVSYGAEGGASLGGKPYRLVQFHFHAPSEHTVNGKPLAMEAHLVHKDAAGHLAVVGLFYKEGRANPFLDQFWKAMPKEAGPERSIGDITLRVAEMLPKDKSYYHYTGSLTTPPCSEGVNWYVLKKPLEASRAQISQFAALFVHNERPVQPLGGRTIYSVRDTGEVVPVALAALGAASGGGGHDSPADAGGHGGATKAGDAHGAGAAAKSGATHGESASVHTAEKKDETSSIWAILGWIALGLGVVGAILAIRSNNMFKNLKIGVRLGIGFGLVLVLLTAIATTSLLRIAEITTDTVVVVDDHLPKIDMSSTIMEETLIEGIAVRNLVLSTDKSVEKAELDIIHKAEKATNDMFDKIKPLLKTARDKEAFEKIVTARAKYEKVLDELLPLAESSSPTHNAEKATALLLGEYEKDAEEYEAIVKHFATAQDEAAREAGKDAIDTAASAKSLVLVLSVVAAAIGIAFAWWVTLSITKPINEAVGVADELAQGNLTVKIEVDSKDETGMLLTSMSNMVGKLSHIISEVNTASDALNNAAGQVSETAQSLSQASSEQAASVEETTASIEEMTASITQNTENAKVTNNMATKSSQEAVEGGEAVKETVEAMKSIAGKIGIIDDIAYQTNLLALNAAIEAARAGEHGKGFAVVAAEVRKLAERSQVAAQEIGELAGSSVKMAEKAGKLLDEMVPSIKKTSDLVQEIAAASQEQTAGVGQINGAMGQLNQATQQNASSSEELAATAEEMGGQAGQLQELMSFFKIDLGSGSKSARPAARTAAAPGKRNAGARPTAKKAAATEGDGQDFERF